MNVCVINGRLTRDPDVRYNNEMCIARYTLAVDRRFKRDTDQKADFISVVAFGKSGEFIEKYCHKGTKLNVVGRIQTGSYERDGQRIYTMDVVAEYQEFGESKASNGDGGKEYPKGSTEPKNGSHEATEGFMKVDDDLDLPFV